MGPLLRETDQERILYNLISEVTQHRFRYVLLVTETNPGTCGTGLQAV